MSTHIKVGCKGSTLHGHVCMIEIVELMVNPSTENALHCIVLLLFLNIGMKIHSCLNSLDNCVHFPRRMLVPANCFFFS